MATFTNLVTTIHVWLTALMMLVAGIPQLRCGCPGGDVKPSPSAPDSQPAGCCCCGATREACGEAVSSDEKDKCCCCHPSQERPTTDSERGPRAGLQKPRCIKELQRTVSVAPPRTEQSDHQEQAIAPLARTVPVCLPVFPLSPRIWRLHLLPPPTDLITLLQHLTL